MACVLPKFFIAVRIVFTFEFHSLLSPVQHLMSRVTGRKPPSAGRASLTVTSNGIDSTVSELFASYPIKIIAPNIVYDRRAVLAFVLSFGGGLVPGDHVELHAHVCSNARLGLLTQGSTKVYKSLPPEKHIAVQNLVVTVDNGAALLLLPDPVQPFRDSKYKQHQKFLIDRHASLVVLDWVSEGRRALSESWDFRSFSSCNEIWMTLANPNTAGSETGGTKERLLLRDNMILDNEASQNSAYTAQVSMNSMGVFGTLIISGAFFAKVGQFFMREFAAQPRIGAKDWSNKSIPQHHPTPEGLIWSAASVRGCTVVKFGADEVDKARRWLRGMLTAEGTIESEFGHHFLMCLQDR